MHQGSSSSVDKGTSGGGTGRGGSISGASVATGSTKGGSGAKAMKGFMTLSRVDTALRALIMLARLAPTQVERRVRLFQACYYGEKGVLLTLRALNAHAASKAHTLLAALPEDDRSRLPGFAAAEALATTDVAR